MEVHKQEMETAPERCWTFEVKGHSTALKLFMLAGMEWAKIKNLPPTGFLLCYFIHIEEETLEELAIIDVTVLVTPLCSLLANCRLQAVGDHVFSLRSTERLKEFISLPTHLRGARRNRFSFLRSC